MKDKNKGWHELRFEFDPTKYTTDCRHCGRTMFLPKSKLNRYKTCGGECAELYRKNIVEKGEKERQREIGNAKSRVSYQLPCRHH